jgi:RNA polymerase sigma-70 factor (ECF subfamily)
MTPRTLTNKMFTNKAAAGKTDSAELKRRDFAALAHQHETALIRASQRLCRGQQDLAQDLAQDTLVRAYQAFLDGRFEQGSNAWPWLLRILTNLFINDLNHKRRWDSDLDLDTLMQSGGGPAQTHAAPADVPGVDLMARTLDEELEQALAMLSDSLRVCLILSDIEGLSYEETALALGIPIGTVRSRLARARMKMHDLLQDFAQRRGYLH